MPRRCRRGHADGEVCSCEMGNIYRFTEPIVLLAIAQMGQAHGYQITQEAEKMAVTHSGVDSGIIYRTLRRLEQAKCVTSAWDTTGGGPARRVYALTDSGVEHLDEWAQVLRDLTGSLESLTRDCARKAREARTAKGRAKSASK